MTIERREHCVQFMRRTLEWNVTTSNVNDTGMVWLYFSPTYRGREASLHFLVTALILSKDIIFHYVHRASKKRGRLLPVYRFVLRTLIVNVTDGGTFAAAENLFQILFCF